MQHLSDEDLVRIVLSGENEAFEVLIERYQKQIFALAYRLGGNYDEARDMAQEAFIRIFQELHRFDTNRRFFPWMYRVAHNTCINWLHKQPREITPIENVFEQVPSNNSLWDCNPSINYEQLELSEIINQALQTLEENYRLPLILKYLEGMSYQDIAEQLDLPISTIETRLFRGRAMLKKALGKIYKEFD